MAATGALAGSSALTLVSAHTQSEARRAEGRFEAQQFQANARFAQLQARDAERRGETSARQIGEAAQAALGTARAGFATQGVDIGTGSAAETQAGIAAVSAQEQQRVLNDAWREAWGLRVQADDFRTRAGFARVAAEQEATSTLLTGLTSVARDVAAFQVPRRTNRRGPPTQALAAASAPRIAAFNARTPIGIQGRR